MSVPRLKAYYREKLAPALQKELGYKNPMQVPRVEKIVINMGLGKLSDAGRDDKVLESAVEELAVITGQRPVLTRARKSIAGFKLREGAPIGCKVTLRGDRMYEFMDRLFNLALPRVRDFRGVSVKGFDGKGNYTLGIREHIIFPEVDYSKVDRIKGMNITFVTTARNREEAVALLKGLGMPFRNDQRK